MFNYNHTKIYNKHVFDKQLSKSCVLTVCIMLRKNNWCLARLPRISANSNKSYGPYNFQALANISENIEFSVSFTTLNPIIPYLFYTIITTLLQENYWSAVKI